MKKNQIVGAALYQYIIIIALIALGVVTVYSILGSLIKSNLTSYNDQYKTINKQIEKNSISSLKAGSLGGTPDKPISKCSGNTCTIDYGNFILTGVPTNLDDYLQAGGSSGGTDAISALFDQIAEQMKEKGDIEGYEDFKSLANLGHYQAQFQKGFETEAKTCLAEANQIDCIINTVNMATKTVPEMPENLSSLIPDYANYLSNPEGNCITDYRQDIADLGYARFEQKNRLSEEEFEAYAKKYPSFNALSRLDKILENPKYSDNLKNITLALIENNQKISLNQESLISKIICEWGSNHNWGADMREYVLYDTLTGAPTSQYVKVEDGISELTPVLHPQLSTGTHLNASLVCVAGKNLEDGKACY